MWFGAWRSCDWARPWTTPVDWLPPRWTERAKRWAAMPPKCATRDADNADEFREMVLDTLGVAPEVISGEEEARLSFAGAVGGLTMPGPYLMVDIGGGSTEFGFGASTVDKSISIDIGCVRLTE